MERGHGMSGTEFPHASVAERHGWGTRMTCVVVVEGARTMSVGEALARRASGTPGPDRARSSASSNDRPTPGGTPASSGLVQTPGPDERGDSASGLTTAQLIDRIVTLNPSATSEFLSQFSARSLGRYLAHLTAAQEPRGREARWTRPGDSPAIVSARR